MELHDWDQHTQFLFLNIVLSNFICLLQRQSCKKESAADHWLIPRQLQCPLLGKDKVWESIRILYTGNRAEKYLGHLLMCLQVVNRVLVINWNSWDAKQCYNIRYRPHKQKLNPLWHSTLVVKKSMAFLVEKSKNLVKVKGCRI